MLAVWPHTVTNKNGEGGREFHFRNLYDRASTYQIPDLSIHQVLPHNMDNNNKYLSLGDHLE
jgi:hypothetical protein